MTYPEPEAGQVISYSFLWSDEAAAGQAEGRKNRPCAIVLAAAEETRSPQGTRVAVLPITHSRPQDADAAVALPIAVTKHLGLDDQPSWVVLDELNVFLWPGFDLRHLPGQPGRYVYGYLPPRFFRQLLEALRTRRAQRQLKAIRRDK